MKFSLLCFPVLAWCLTLFVQLPLIAAEGVAEPTKPALWNGYECVNFRFDGHSAKLVRPKQAAPGRPWLWRAEFFGHEPQTDLALLEKGWHVAYCKLSDLYGAPVAIEAMRRFQAELEQSYQLAPRTVLLGFSRGGLYAFNYAAAYPEKVESLYLDAPVLDIRSWPGGLGKGRGSAQCWEQCRAVYGLSEAQVKEFKGNPLDHVDAVVKARIPILCVCGDSDLDVPFPENSALLVDKCKALGFPIELILKPGVAHHPHSLKDPAPIVAFILRVHEARRQ